MKKFFRLMLAVAAVSVTLVSCKKGPDDPGFSFRSRTSRVSGDWAINSFSYDSTTTITPANGGNVKTYRYTYNESGATGTLVSTFTNGSNTNVSTTLVTVNSHTYSFDSDGNVTHKINYTLKDTSGNGNTIYTTVLDLVETGNWNFTGGVGDPADMEYMNISYTSVTTNTTTTAVTTIGGVSQTFNDSSTDTRTYGVNQNVMTLHILRCANDELNLEMTINNTSSGSSTTGTVVSNDDKKTCTGVVSIKLKQ